jgi:hypothetical protein
VQYRAVDAARRGYQLIWGRNHQTATRAIEFWLPKRCTRRLAATFDRPFGMVDKDELFANQPAIEG